MKISREPKLGKSFKDLAAKLKKKEILKVVMGTDDWLTKYWTNDATTKHLSG